MITRRAWLQAAVLGAAGTARATGAQHAAGVPDTSNLFAMDQSAARSVRLPRKPGARPGLTPVERDAQEIPDAFVEVYGERALMAPAKEGFNVLAWALPDE